nr:disease resistance protein RPP13-like isoform X6 [Ipomoea batatas]
MDTEGEKSQPYCVKLHQVFQSAKEEIEAIEEELLKIKAEGRKTGHDVLQSLKRLKLLGNCFGWNEINVLCKLPKLEVLKLYDHACVGGQWELSEDDKFCELIVFEIDATDLEDWKATGGHFPKLKHLSLFACKNLKEIPSGFAEIEGLKSIKLAGCRPSVVASAEEIKQDQLDYMNNIVNVVVGKHHGYPPVYEPEPDEA